MVASEWVELSGSVRGAASTSPRVTLDIDVDETLASRGAAAASSAVATEPTERVRERERVERSVGCTDMVSNRLTESAAAPNDNQQLIGKNGQTIDRYQSNRKPNQTWTE